MKTLFSSLLFFGLTTFGGASAAPPLAEPIAKPDLVFEEVDGLVAVEAEHFLKQEKSDVRAWYLTTKDQSVGLKPDADPNHVAGAGGGAYLEILPDTRKNHGEKLIKGENFSNEAGKMAILSYKVHFNTPGKYYVWARTHSTGTEDNGLHVGIDGTWPPSGQRMQWTGKKKWVWGSKQRTEKVHGGVPGLLFLNIDKAGEHLIQFSMREDGFEFDQWLMTTDAKFKAPAGVAPVAKLKAGKLPKPFKLVAATAPAPKKAAFTGKLFGERGEDGNGDVTVSGELKQWHKVTLTLDGPFAHEKDNQPNPFTDYRFEVTFTPPSGRVYTVPGYFAADGNAGESSAQSGNQWRAHFAPDQPGKWGYKVSFVSGNYTALGVATSNTGLAPFDGNEGSFTIAPSDKKGRDLRGKGRLDYVGKHHLRFAGSGEYFLKAGADAPETFLGYTDFDGTVALKPDKVPLKTWKAHVQDWKPGDPTWKKGKGKGMIGAINYLSGKGCNVFSFLPYNAGGDGDNVWPFIGRDDKFHYDCSKLDQWSVVFDHGTAKGMYLHFKLQETENDDNTRGGHNGSGKGGKVPTSLDGGDLGMERMLYCRELIARFGHNLALNWNLGEENTQTTKQQQDMAQYIADIDAYDHLIVVHTYPNQQEKIYRPLFGDASVLRGASLQNSNIKDCHSQVVKWTKESAAAGTPWVVAFDEPGTASEGMPADPGYPGMPDNFDNPSIHDVRKFALWGTLLGGGGGVEYYFGYKLPQNDLICEDWRSRDKSWDYCRIALEFFADEKIPFADMTSADALVGNAENNNSAYCYAKENEIYLVYLPTGGERQLDLSAASGNFSVQWFNPREGGAMTEGGEVSGGGKKTLQAPDADNDWLAVVTAKTQQAAINEVEIHKGIVFAEPDGVELLLDLHLPKGVENPPLLMFIHGGGWKGGSRSNVKLNWVAKRGFAVASIEYRLSQEALFPAQIFDCKGALRWLRAHQDDYGYDASRVVVAGTSAGGHLAALMGTSGEVDDLEGDTGGNADQSSRVQGIIDYYGPSDFVERSKNHPAKTDHHEGGVYRLLGGPVKENLEAARRASPVTYISKDDPPLLILHGDQDKTVFIDQSEHFEKLYRDAGLDVHLHVAVGSGHGWKEQSETERKLVLDFLQRHLRH